MNRPPSRRASFRGWLREVFQTRYREATLPALLFGIVVGLIMNVAITYAGLKIGFTIGGSAIAAVLGWGFLRGILRRGTIVENNICQTVASAVNTVNSGVIFTVPVLILMAIPYNIWVMGLACIAGAFLGVAFIIPTRRQMIDFERLRFPTGTAVATVLRSPGAGVAKSVILLVGIGVSMFIYFFTESHMLGIPGYGALRDALGWQWLEDARMDLGRALGLPPEFFFVWAIAPFSLGAGFITGRPGLAVLAGGVLAYFIVTPLAFNLGWIPPVGYHAEQWQAVQVRFLPRPLEEIPPPQAPPDESAPRRRFQGVLIDLGEPTAQGSRELHLRTRAGQKQTFYLTEQTRIFEPGGARVPVAALRPGSIIEIHARRHRVPDVRGELENYARMAINRPLGIGMLLGGALVGIVVALPALRAALKGIRAARSGGQGSEELPLPVLAVAIVVAFFALFAAARFGAGVSTGMSLAIALVGTAWMWFAGIIIAQCTGMTDWSPISGMALLTVVIVLVMSGQQILAAVMIGAAVCVAITLAADMMQDLKTGYLVGGRPATQQFLQLAVVWIGPLVSLAMVGMIAQDNIIKYGIPMGDGTDTEAPQAQALRAAIEGITRGDIAWDLYGAGTLLGILLSAGGVPGLGVLVGLSMYLPFDYMLPYGLGCILSMICQRIRGAQWTENWGVPFAAGLLIGEPLLAVVFTILRVFFGLGG